MSPITLRVEVSKSQFNRLTSQNARHSRRDLSRYEFETAARGFVIEENPAAGVKPVRLPIVLGELKTGDLADSIARTGMKTG